MPLSRKRKAITRDAQEEPGIASGDEFEGGLLNGTLDLSGDDDEDFENESNEDEGGELGSDGEEEEIGSDEIPSDEEQVNGDLIKSKKNNIEKEENDMQLDAEEDQPNYTVTTDANGNPRYLYDEIDPVYDSDDSDAPQTTNTIGNIPLSFYDQYPHIGYDIDGKRILRPANPKALDELLDKIEIPEGWTGLTDPATGKPLQLSKEELEILRKIQMNEVPEEGYDPYPATVEWFTSKQEIIPLSAAPEPKRRFVPSKHEAKRVMKIVKAIREGRILPYRSPEEEDEEADEKRFNYDIWANEAPRPDHPMNMPAPKLPPPGYDLSYHPPPEYIPDESEKKAWEEADKEDREKDYLPKNYDALRKVPGHDQFIKERFERSLDLYLAPRVRRTKLNIDPESLLPKLPSPETLRPFPTSCAAIFRGHNGRVRSIAINPMGQWAATGGDDGTVRIWQLVTGRQVWSVKLSDEPIDVVRWRPGRDTLILSAASGDDILLIVPPICDPEIENSSYEVLDAGWGYAKSNNAVKKETAAQWTRPTPRLTSSGVVIKITLRKPAKVITWHRRGEFFSTISPQGQSSAIAIHTLSKHLTQLPLRRLKGLPQAASFHPSKPIFFVATQHSIRCYDLSRQELLKILQPGARFISSLDVHPGGDNLIVGSYDKRLLWHDLDLSVRPYKTLRFHKRAVRAVRFHQGGLPLFADASDDGTVQVLHGMVVGDLMENATIVPLKVLRGHQVTGQLGVMDLDFHPREPWLVSAGADGTCRLWT
ncbi:MAG: Ribosome biogenesis protein erb1 [Cirrosporium novae-zelandiae]|nr:MAG: Ribosome biogenesis protein erb1 [Cirrosporium novae-zelandiae]